MQECINDWFRRRNTMIIIAILALFSFWAILAIQFHLIPLMATCMSDKTVSAVNKFLLTLSYSYIAALIFYIVTYVLPSKQRKYKLESIINRKVLNISRCIRDILLEFYRDTDYELDIRDTTNTEAILKSKDWFSIVPFIHQYQKVPITYLGYLERCCANMKSQISDLIIKYHTEMTAEQLVELENLSDSPFLKTINFICSMPNSSIADSGYASLIREFREMQEQYLKVEKEFGIE